MITLYIKTVSTVSTNTIDKSENGNSENYSIIYYTTIKLWLYKYVYSDSNMN